MTPRQRAVIERARQAPPRIIEIPSPSRNAFVVSGPADLTKHHRRAVNRLSVSELLEDELMRLCRTWGRS